MNGVDNARGAVQGDEEFHLATSFAPTSIHFFHYLSMSCWFKIKTFFPSWILQQSKKANKMPSISRNIGGLVSPQGT